MPQKVKDVNEEEIPDILKFCFLCQGIVTKDKNFVCFNTSCKETFHVVCLGRDFVSSQSEKNQFILPIDGSCPKCKSPTLWGDVIRYVSGCYREEL